MSLLDSPMIATQSDPTLRIAMEPLPASKPLSHATTRAHFTDHRRGRRVVDALFRLAAIGATVLAVIALVYLLVSICSRGLPRLDLNFLISFPSRHAVKAGIKAALWGSAYLMVLTAVIAVPLGIAAAIYLEEFALDTPLRRLIDINLANLAGVPSIIYGMLGLAVFVRLLGLGRSLLSGALTMSLLILPVLVVAAREALKAVPPSVRQAALALGATRWQSIRSQVLPAAAPGIMTGVILALSRATGETAPLLMIGALSYMAFVPESPSDPFTALPIQIFNWAARPQEEFHTAAAAAIIVLLAMLLTTNAIAIAVRHHYQRKVQW